MATKKTVAKATKTKEVAPAAKGTKQSSEEKAAKRKARMEALKNRPEGQRPNSKQVDIIELEGGQGSVATYAQTVRKFGVVITSIAMDVEGNIVSTSVTTLPGVRVKTKKGHGNIVPGTPGTGRKGSTEEVEEDGDED